ncbi:MAG TPA: NAD(P)-binding protein [Polyangia bacterium]|nr:NAD(P)-binding protein [Polyangia bacterium]
MRGQVLKSRLLFLWVLVRQFRWTLFALTVAVGFGGALFAVTPHAQLGGHRPPLITALFCAWMALFAQPILAPPETWYLALLGVVYPLLGVILVGEGVVRLALLMISREHGEKEWMKVMASTYRKHVVLCGLGHLGYRILGQLVAARTPVVAIEKDPDCRFLAESKATGAPVLLRDMKEDQALVDAGVQHAQVIIIATNDDMANLEVALDSRRMNPKIRVIMRLFDQQIADKIRGAFLIDEAFSSAALAAPIVAAMAQEAGVLASFKIGPVLYVTAEVAVAPGSVLAGRRLADLEAERAARVLARTPAGTDVPETAPAGSAVVGAGDRLVVHIPITRMDALAAAARAEG